jgi:hypothetical protein
MISLGSKKVLLSDNLLGNFVQQATNRMDSRHGVRLTRSLPNGLIAAPIFL